MIYYPKFMITTARISNSCLRKKEVSIMFFLTKRSMESSISIRQI